MGCGESVTPVASEVKEERGQQFAPGTSPSPTATSCDGGEACEVPDRGTEGGRGVGCSARGEICMFICVMVMGFHFRPTCIVYCDNIMVRLEKFALHRLRSHGPKKSRWSLSRIMHSTLRLRILWLRAQTEVLNKLARE